MLLPGTFWGVIRDPKLVPTIFLRCPFGTGVRPKGPRAWLEGVSGVYFKPLSTDMKRVGARRVRLLVGATPGRDGIRGAWERSRESVTYVGN